MVIIYWLISYRLFPGKNWNSYAMIISQKAVWLVEGRLQISRDYEKDGQKRRAADVVAQNIEFLDYKQPASNTAASSNESPMNALVRKFSQRKKSLFKESPETTECKKNRKTHAAGASFRQRLNLLPH
jgi:single-stranded DNA-binding protein